MLTGNIISDSVPSIKTSDTAERVLAWMSEFKTAHLPVVNNVELLGMISEEDLLDLDDPANPIGDVRLSIPETAFVYDDSHVYDALRMMSTLHLDLLPVLSSRDNQFVGLVTREDLLETTADMLGVKEPGGVIILEVAHNSYSLSEIGRICESNDAKVLSLAISPSSDHSVLFVTLKLNLREMSRVISTFERFDYKIVKVIFDAEQLDDFRERYENLLRYLNI